MLKLSIIFLVIISSNAIELYTLFEQMHCVLLQTNHDDPNFINIVTSTQINENGLVDLTLESFVQEIDILIEQFNKIL